MYPVFACLRNQKDNKFALTKEANDAINQVKNCLKEKTMLYNIDFSSPLYLCTDASNVGMGG